MSEALQPEAGQKAPAEAAQQFAPTNNSESKADAISEIVVVAPHKARLLGEIVHGLENAALSVPRSVLEGAKDLTRIPQDVAGLINGKSGAGVDLALHVSGVAGAALAVSNPVGTMVASASQIPTGWVADAAVKHFTPAPAPSMSAEQDPAATGMQALAVPPVPESLAGLPKHVLEDAAGAAAALTNSNGVVNPANAAKQNTQTVGIAT